MTYPWMKFHTRDWLDNKELRRCSPLARSVLSDLMCLAHEGAPYGYLTDKLGALTESYMAARCVVSARVFRAAVNELKAHERLHEDSGVLFIERMVRDEAIRSARAGGGQLGGNPSLGKKVNLTSEITGDEGYPSLKSDSCERTRAGSDSGSKPSRKSVSEKPPTAFEVELSAAARRIHERHPAIRRCGIGEIEDKLRAIARRLPVADRFDVLHFVDTQHEAWCATEDWQKENGQYAKGLDNWLAPTKRRWENNPPDQVLDETQTMIAASWAAMEERNADQ